MKNFLANRVAFILLSLMALAVIVMGTVVAFWLYSVPDKALTVNKSPLPVITKDVKMNSYVVIELDYCKNIKNSGRVATSMIGANTQLMLPPGNESGPKQCQDVRAALPIPPQATPGIYHFHFRAVYVVNPLRTIVQEYDTENFVISK